MYRSLAGIAAVVALAAVAVPTAPANAAAIRHASGITEQQPNVEAVQYRYRRGYRGYYGGPRRYYGGYRRPYYGGYYPYAYAPYPYYRRYYRPRPFVGIGIGPVGVGVW